MIHNFHFESEYATLSPQCMASTCYCRNGYTGDDCSLSICPSPTQYILTQQLTQQLTQNTTHNTAHNTKENTAPNTAPNAKGNTGHNTAYNANGLLFNTPCSGRGVCVQSKDGVGVCNCDLLFSGDACERDACPGRFPLLLLFLSSLSSSSSSSSSSFFFFLLSFFLLVCMCNFRVVY